MSKEITEIHTSKRTITRLYQTQGNKTTPSIWHVEKKRNHQTSSASAFTTSCILFLQRLFLPVGYPKSVRPEYLRYQVIIISQRPHLTFLTPHLTFLTPPPFLPIYHLSPVLLILTRCGILFKAFVHIYVVY